ncbi:MAG TPA: peptidylprolyl isomerase [Bdellovibrionales bacterium]|nr:peptidylprolyl isomerase [Bdellovibrionales bacterium]
MSLPVETDRVVKLTYRILTEDGRVLEEKTPENPYEYLQGHNQIVGPVERAVEGKTAGFRCEVNVTPRDGYGDYKPDLVTELPVSHFPAGVELKVGMKFGTRTAEGQAMTIRILEIEGDVVTVDGNHPLAGLELIFEVRVLDVREASEGEIEAGRPGVSLSSSSGSGSLH